MNKLKTILDDIVLFIKSENNNRIEVKTISEKYKVPIPILENWLIILENNKIIKLDYSGFKENIVYIEQEEEQKNKSKKSQIKKSVIDEIAGVKSIFLYKSKKRDIDTYTIQDLWGKYLMNYLPIIKREFWEKAQERKLPSNSIESFWNKYYEEVLKI